MTVAIIADYIQGIIDVEVWMIAWKAEKEIGR